MSIPPATSLPNSPGWSRLIERLRAATAGRFTIVRELGRGGFAAVFLAQQTQPSRPVAIKLLLPAHLESEWALEHFRGESQKIANWRHQSVVTIYEVHEIEDLFFFVMSYVEGGSLHELIDVLGPLTVPMTRSVLAQMGSALQYAHRQGVTHRDIKPQNVLIDTDGGAVVTDFGISKQSGGTTHTVTGMIFGTAPYMAPEQCESGTTSKWSDQYAIGIVAYEMLMGTPPFTGPATSVLLAHLHKPIPSIRENRADVPVELEAAIMRMLEKDPEKRFPTVVDAMQAAGVIELPEHHPDRMAFAQAARRISAEGRTQVLEIVSIPPVIEVGDNIRINATAKTSAGEPLVHADIKWSVRDGELARVDSANGLLTALIPGVTSLFVQSGNVTQEIQIEIRAPRAASIELSGITGPVRLGESAQFFARTMSQRGAVISATPNWISTDPSIAQITNTGAVRALRVGRARITATVDDASAECWVEVTAAGVAEVRVAGTTNTIDVGDSRQLRAVVLDAFDHPLDDRAVVWSSSDRRIATVSPSGILSAVAVGTASVTAQCEGQNATIPLTVRAPRVASVEVLSPSNIVKVGDRVRLNARVRGVHGDLLEREVHWLSDDVAIATVDSNGMLAAIAPGSVIVSAAVDDVSAATMVDVAPRTTATPVISVPPAAIIAKPAEISPPPLETQSEPQIAPRVEDYPSLANTGFVQRAHTPVATSTESANRITVTAEPATLAGAAGAPEKSASRNKGVLIGGAVALAALIAIGVSMSGGARNESVTTVPSTQTATGTAAAAPTTSAAAFHDSIAGTNESSVARGSTRPNTVADNVADNKAKITIPNAPSAPAANVSTSKQTLQLVVPRATLTVDERLAFSTRVMRDGKRVEHAPPAMASRDERTVAIDNGSLVARGAGITWVVATSGDLRDSVLVTVNQGAVAQEQPPAYGAAKPASSYSEPAKSPEPSSAMTAETLGAISLNWFSNAGKKLPAGLSLSDYANDLRKNLSSISWPPPARVTVTSVDGNKAEMEFRWEGRNFVGARKAYTVRMKVHIEGRSVQAAELLDAPASVKP